jgi:hypothetical protein
MSIIRPPCDETCEHGRCGRYQETPPFLFVEGQTYSYHGYVSKYAAGKFGQCLISGFQAVLLLSDYIPIKEGASIARTMKRDVGFQ